MEHSKSFQRLKFGKHRQISVTFWYIQFLLDESLKLPIQYTKPEILIKALIITVPHSHRALRDVESIAALDSAAVFRPASIYMCIYIYLYEGVN